MNHSAVAVARSQFISQLLYFDEQCSMFLDDYYPDHTKERKLMENLIRRYSASLENILAQSDADLYQSLHSAVFIGSSTKIKYRDDGFEETYTIVFPTQTDPDMNRISFLSPIGRQLLLAPGGARITLEIPAGKLDVEILEVKYADIGALANNEEELA